jgi:hypothetical protein
MPTTARENMTSLRFPNSLFLFALLTSSGCVPGDIDLDDESTVDTTSGDESDEIGDPTDGVDDSTDETDETDETETSTDTGTDLAMCDGEFAEVDCVEGVCQARWIGTEAWSFVLGFETIDSWPAVGTDAVFDCGPTPSDVDGCGKIDASGHVACWIWEGECARIAFPLCVVAGSAVATSYWPDWMPCDAGEPIGAVALCSDQFCWMESDPTSSIHPHC